MRLPRLLQLLLALLLMATLAWQWQQMQQQRLQLQQNQQQQLAEHYLQYASHGAAMALALDDLDALQWGLDQWLQDPTIIAISVFSYQGERLAHGQNLFPPHALPDETTLSQALARFPPLTVPIQDDQKAYGYLRLRLNRSLMMRDLRRQDSQSQLDGQRMLLLFGLLGALLARGLSFKRARYSSLRHAEQKKRAQPVAEPVDTEVAAITAATPGSSQSSR
ncbi:AhpA/YtjB family protein [Ferrimonas marina]|uniref:Membrane protein n=1 Tax=Ferrimonas marina TaxID=299255 RepID=A0A1M5V995_9GAMM|nr:AhpA/YtjB family protein [Ferrimonas marina]SHH71796.1 membrane protein [Ferrimonas marina]